MELCENTLDVLRNFSSINQNIMIRSGNNIKTMSATRNMIATADVSEQFTKDFGIYDLNQFLNGMGLHHNPELDFNNDGYVVIKEGKMRSKYFFADPQVIVTPPDKPIELPSEDVSFTLSTDQLDKLLKAAGIYQLPDLAVVGKNGVVKIQVRDKKNDTSNDFAITVGETDDTFEFNFKVENIKILPGTYDVVVSKKLLSRFTSQNYNLKYYIALEPDSTFE